jgi:hypothetical protein
VIDPRKRSGWLARTSSTFRRHAKVSGSPPRPFATQRLPVACSECSSSKPPVMRTSTPCRTNSTVACDTAELLTGRCRMSVPATVVTGATICIVNTERPVFDSSRSARPGPLSVVFIARLTGRPSSFASRTIRPSGIAMRTQPFLITSTVSRASPVARSPSTLRL